MSNFKFIEERDNSADDRENRRLSRRPKQTLQREIEDGLEERREQTKVAVTS